MSIYPKEIMRFTLAFLIFLSPFSVAQEVKTESFTINLPDKLKVQTDKVRRILAFGPKHNPFISIEFGKGVNEQYSDIALRVKDTLASMGGRLSPKSCGDGCEAMYGKAQVKNEGLTLYSYFYLVKSNKQSFIISVASQTKIESGELEVTNIAKQILQSGI
ncbi:hypothetical protein V6260_02820 [Pseudoalteromonas aliena]|uniref:hypothetical protein n=1 Tax=Pseudoalteromonas aliena TaxID=247523 RepID=UPI00311F4FEB